MSYFENFKETKAFTLIELLVVIAIIGILSSVVLASLNGARESARDARRGTDMNQISTALQMYATECNGYPDTTGTVSSSLSYSGASCGKTLGDYMSQVPNDPNGSAYGYSGSQTSYCIVTTMEGDEAPDNDSNCESGSETTPSNGGATYSIGN